MYFISDHCRYVKGAYSSAIYDLSTGKVYSLNHDATILLDYALNDNILEEAKPLIESLRECHLLDIRSSGGETQTESEGNVRMTEESDKNESVVPMLRYVWLELTNACNCKCIHCYGGFGFNNVTDRQEEMSVNEWKEIIGLIKQNGGNSIQFIGGEPLIYKGFIELLLYAWKSGIENIDIFTNATLLDHDTVNVIKMTGASVRVSLYGYDKQTHESITQCPGSFEKLDKGLELLKENSVPTTIAIVLMRENQDYLESIKAYIESKGHKYTGFDTVRPVFNSRQECHNVTRKDIEKERFIHKPSFTTSSFEFAKNREWNSCWFGKFAVTSTGDVIPCIFARNRICGNIRRDSMEVIRQNLISDWRIGKNCIEVCKDCEFRFACEDCRPLAENTDGRLLSKYPRCLYDPYSGVWKEDLP